MTERANAVATLQKATELYSQELTAAKLQHKLNAKEQQQPGEALVIELQRCQEGLRRQVTLAST